MKKRALLIVVGLSLWGCTTQMSLIRPPTDEEVRLIATCKSFFGMNGAECAESLQRLESNEKIVDTCTSTVEALSTPGCMLFISQLKVHSESPHFDSRGVYTVPFGDVYGTSSLWCAGRAKCPP